MSFLHNRICQSFYIALLSIAALLCISFTNVAQAELPGNFTNNDYILDDVHWSKMSDHPVSYSDAERICAGKLTAINNGWRLPTESELRYFHERVISRYSEEKGTWIRNEEVLAKLGWSKGKLLWVLYDPERSKQFNPGEGTNIPGFFFLDSGAFRIHTADRFKKNYAMCIYVPNGCESIKIRPGPDAGNIGRNNMRCNGNIVGIPNQWGAYDTKGSCTFNSFHDESKMECSGLDLNKCARSGAGHVEGSGLDVDFCACTCKSRFGSSKGVAIQKQ